MVARSLRHDQARSHRPRLATVGHAWPPSQVALLLAASEGMLDEPVAGCSGDESTALLSGLLDTLRTQASGRLDEIARKGMLTPAASEELQQVAAAYLQDTS